MQPVAKIPKTMPMFIEIPTFDWCSVGRASEKYSEVALTETEAAKPMMSLSKTKYQ